MKNRKKGFTVVELVIVIAVIAILSAILIPTFVGLTNKANDAALQENLRNSYVKYSVENAETADVATQYEVVLSKTEISATENVKVYQYNVENGKYVEVTLSGTFTALGGGEAYNGYYLYTYHA